MEPQMIRNEPYVVHDHTRPGSQVVHVAGGYPPAYYPPPAHYPPPQPYPASHYPASYYPPAPAPWHPVSPVPVPQRPAPANNPFVNPQTGRVRWGLIVDIVAQGLAALNPLPGPPQPTGVIATDQANAVTYQANLAGHAKTDERIRTLGGVVHSLWP